MFTTAMMFKFTFSQFSISGRFIDFRINYLPNAFFASSKLFTSLVMFSQPSLQIACRTYISFFAHVILKEVNVKHQRSVYLKLGLGTALHAGKDLFVAPLPFDRILPEGSFGLSSLASLWSPLSSRTTGITRYLFSSPSFVARARKIMAVCRYLMSRELSLQNWGWSMFGLSSQLQFF